MKFLVTLCIAFLFASCLSDEQQQEILNADSAAAAEVTVDTFIVAKGQNILSNETDEGDSLRAENDTAIDNIRIAITGSQTPEDEIVGGTSSIVKNPDVGPSFPGGSVAMDAHIKKHLIYPAVAFQNDITGTVNVRFVIETDGRLTGIIAQNKLGFGCDESAVDLIKGMPKWTPGKKGGVNVRCSVVLPITFTRPE